MARNMQLPCIHPNGTSKTALLDALCEASLALDDAYDKLKETAPHGRDYYPLGPQALEQATAEHLDRLRRLDSVKEEIDAIARAIDPIT